MLDSRREVRWDYLLPKEFAAAVEECPVCYMPLGTLERHGAHLPFGLDAMKAHGLCLRAAQEYGGVVLPPLHWGTHGWWAEDYRRGDDSRWPADKQPPGSVYIHEGLLINLLLSMFREIEYADFKVCVVLTGHYPTQQVAAVKSAAQQHMVSNPLKVWALCEPELSGEVEVGADHAGKWETSLLMYLDPGMQDLSLLPQDRTQSPIGTSNNGVQDANAAFWQRAVKAIVEAVRERVTVFLNEPGRVPGHGAPV